VSERLSKLVNESECIVFSELVGGNHQSKVKNIFLPVFGSPCLNEYALILHYSELSWNTEKDKIDDVNTHDTRFHQ